jgi:hypothetical protein
MRSRGSGRVVDHFDPACLAISKLKLTGVAMLLTVAEGIRTYHVKFCKDPQPSGVEAIF